MSNALEYVSSKQLLFKLAYSKDGHEIILKYCPYCHDNNFHVYLNENTEVFYCHKCQIGGTLLTFKEKLGDLMAPVSFQDLNIDKETIQLAPEHLLQVQEAHDRLLHDKETLWYLSSRRWTLEAVQYFKLGLSEEEGIKWLHYTIFSNGNLKNVKMRTLPPAERRFKRLFGGESLLFNVDILLENPEYIIICEGEADAISVWSKGFHNVIGATVGAGVIKPEWIDQLDKCKQIIFVYDNDDAGQNGAQKFASRLGIERCKNILLPSGYKDINEYFIAGKTAQDFQKLIDNAEPFGVENVLSLGNIIRNTIRKLNSEDREDRLELPWKNVNRLINGFEPGDLIVVAAKPKVGKCLGKDTSVLMYDGTSKLVQDIRENDLLMGDDSTPRTVLETTHGLDTLYKISYKGGSYVVNNNHILSLMWSKNVYSRYRKHGDIIDISIDQYLKLNKTQQINWKGYRVKVDFHKNNQLPIPPRMLGIWLGDGTSTAPNITNINIEIINYCRDYAESINIPFKKTSAKYGWSISNNRQGNHQHRPNIFLQHLQKLQLINNKHIPYIYKVTDRIGRLELLAGLIDTDGNIYKYGYEIVSKFDTLANDIIFVARSLGFVANKNIRYIKQKPYYVIHISGEHINDIPVLIKYKQRTYEIRTRDALINSIHITKLPIGEYFGFELDGNGRFLLGDFTVTHNSSFAFDMLYYFSTHEIPSLLFSLEMATWRILPRLVALHKRKDSRDCNSAIVLAEAYKELNDVPLYFAYKYMKPNWNFVADTVRHSVRHYGIRFMVFDNLHFLCRSLTKQTEEVSVMSQNFKLLAEELALPIVLIARPRKTNSKIISGEDLKNSSDIEGDLDILITLSRERKKSISGEEIEGAFESQTLIDIPACRYAPGGSTYLYANDAECRFDEL